MTTTIRIEGGQLQISQDGRDGPQISLSIDDWRALNETVEALIDDTYVSYNDAASRLGVHRSTLNDWRAQGKLESIVIGRRGYVTAASLAKVLGQRSVPPSRPATIELTAPTKQTPAQYLPNASPLSSSPQAQTLVRQLTDQENAIEPRRFPGDAAQAKRPGMYSWWGDDEACAVLGEEIGIQLPHLLYVGQTGATSINGLESAATLAKRIGRQHIRGNTRSSTFRHTISSLLAGPLSLESAGGGRLDSASNARMSAWIADHLRIAIAPFDDRDTLGNIEKGVIAYLDPPLNLDYCPRTAARARIRQRRGALGR